LVESPLSSTNNSFSSLLRLSDEGGSGRAASDFCQISFELGYGFQTLLHRGQKFLSHNISDLDIIILR